MAKDNEKKELVFKCKDCGKEYDRMGKLKYHKNRCAAFQKANRLRFEVGSDTKLYDRMGKLEDHKNTCAAFQKANQLRFEAMTFVIEQWYGHWVIIYRMAKDNEKKELVFKCKDCGKEYDRMGKLKDHKNRCAAFQKANRLRFEACADTKLYNRMGILEDHKNMCAAFQKANQLRFEAMTFGLALIPNCP
ncbi:PREDICTED: uncharacterized protein LOC109181214 [Ipomoea nil]|uniref:uncharacterized protein LOC109181214 n=1 Tax=Ipomoea nil TaxID=35883 RepID=UPI0009011F31|nr:PREDICTED: uncharacterized protein LOC109181214 [Ipomoea nil]